MNSDWIHDYVSAVLQSRRWEAEVMSFVDENCIVFDTEEENKLEYTRLHDEFKVLVDRVLQERLSEVGITEDDFTEACGSFFLTRRLGKSVIEQIVSMDDFVAFKGMMVRRNVALEAEALKALEECQGWGKSNDKEDEPNVVRQSGDGTQQETSDGGRLAESDSCATEKREAVALDEDSAVCASMEQMLASETQDTGRKTSSSTATDFPVCPDNLKVGKSDAKMADLPGSTEEILGEAQLMNEKSEALTEGVKESSEDVKNGSEEQPEVTASSAPATSDTCHVAASGGDVPYEKESEERGGNDEVKDPSNGDVPGILEGAPEEEPLCEAGQDAGNISVGPPSTEEASGDATKSNDAPVPTRAPPPSSDPEPAAAATHPSGEVDSPSLAPSPTTDQSPAPVSAPAPSPRATPARRRSSVVRFKDDAEVLSKTPPNATDVAARRLSAANRNHEAFLAKQRAKAERLDEMDRIKAERARREEHLRRQRDLLVEKKRAERERRAKREHAVESYAGAGAGADGGKRRPSRVHRIAPIDRRLSSGGGNDNGAAGEALDSSKQQMRIALAARMKESLLQAEATSSKGKRD